MKKIDKKTYKHIQKLHGKLEAAILEANEAMVELQGLAESAADEAEAYFDDQSEGWQESSAGEVYQEWVDALREASEAFEDELDEAPDLEEIFPQEPELFEDPDDYDEDDDDDDDDDEDDEEEDEEDDEDEDFDDEDDEEAA